MIFYRIIKRLAYQESKNRLSGDGALDYCFRSILGICYIVIYYTSKQLINYVQYSVEEEEHLYNVHTTHQYRKIRQYGNI